MTIVGVLLAEGAAGIRDLQVAAEEHDLQLLVVPGRGYSEPHQRPILGVLGTVIDGSDDELIRDLDRRGAEGIVTFADSELHRLAVLAGGLGLPGPTLETVETIASKYRQRCVLRDAGVSQVGVVPVLPPAVPEGMAALSFPAILKPDRGVSSRDTFLVESLAAAPAVIARAPREPCVLESLIATRDPVRDGWLGDYVSVESCVDARGTVQHFGVTERLPLERPFRERGDVVPGALDASIERQLTALVEAAASALGIGSSFLHTEIKLSDPPEIVEVNCRLGGYVDALYRKVGVESLLYSAIEVALGRVPNRATAAVGTAVMRSFLPPLGAEKVVSVPSAAELSDVTAVWKIEMLKRPGDHVSWREGTRGRVLDVWLEAADREQARRHLAALEEQMESLLTFA